MVSLLVYDIYIIITQPRKSCRMWIGNKRKTKNDFILIDLKPNLFPGHSGLSLLVSLNGMTLAWVNLYCCVQCGAEKQEKWVIFTYTPVKMSQLILQLLYDIDKRGQHCSPSGTIWRILFNMHKEPFCFTVPEIMSSIDQLSNKNSFGHFS